MTVIKKKNSPIYKMKTIYRLRIAQHFNGLIIKYSRAKLLCYCDFFAIILLLGYKVVIILSDWSKDPGPTNRCGCSTPIFIYIAMIFSLDLLTKTLDWGTISLDSEVQYGLQTDKKAC